MSEKATSVGRDSSPTVLVVEDFADARQMLAQFLVTGGCRVLEATNGREAIEVVKAEKPALVLMDLNMPILDGFTATVRIREDAEISNVPVVAITAYDTAEFRAAARAVGCNEYIAKPIDFDQLTRLLERFLPSSQTMTNASRAD